MAEETKEIENTLIQPEFCDPCSIHGKESEASAFCKICEENLCEICTKDHATRKVTKEHKPIPIQEKQNYLTKSCDSCIENPNDAVKYCEYCEEYLCSACVNAHSKRKATKHHVPTDLTLIEKDPIESDESERVCDICLKTGQTVKAESYCEQCTELLCIVCKNIHKNSKATRLHKPIPVADMPDAKPMHSSKNCEPCELSDILKQATQYCEECKEFLCDSCGTRHGIQKSTMSHKLKNASDIDSYDQCCDVCLKINEENQAVLVCEKCNEALCKKCVISHQNQKATRDHALLQLQENASDGKEQGQKLCDICNNKKLNKAAHNYCKNCEMYLCDSCKDKHIRQKMNRDHEITDANEASNSNMQFCVHCLNVNEEVPAVNICLECSEELCGECTDSHKLQKQSKNHRIIDINLAPKSDIEECVPCKDNNKTSQAVKYCMICKEYLCEDCCKFHRRYKQTMTHEVKDISEYKKENKCDCDPCMFSDNKEVEAESFCKDCDEFLCSSCTKRHKAARLSRNHTYLSAEEGRAHSLENALLCDPCKYLEKSKAAFAFCEKCRELLCDLCYKQHSAQKQTREHQLLTDLSKYKGEYSGEEPNGRHEKQDKEPEVLYEQTLSSVTDIPGKPTLSSAKADSVTIVWDKPSNFDDKRDYYQISYKEGGREKWKFFTGEHVIANVKVTDLKASTKYIFRVRVVHPNGEGKYSEESDIIETIISPAAQLVDFSTIVKKGKPSPSVYGVPITEVANARNILNKTKKFEVGRRRIDLNKEKTIMLVGATGTGKSTLVDGLVNFALGVNWSDKFRFTIIDLEEEEKSRTKNQALSQTEWITVYTIHPESGGRLEYRLNIIDTPGFGDTRGLERDQQIVEQIRALFSEAGAKGVACIDAICFLIKAPDARLTAVQNYIFQSIMALFGKDVEQNICSLITFADGIVPPVLAALQESGLPFGKHFTFNNSGLFAKNDDLENAGLSPMFWDMGQQSFQAFFAHLDLMETKSLQLTKNVLDERKRLETTVQNLQPQVDAGLAKLNMLNEEIRIIKQHKLDADANKDFQYEVEEIEQHRHELPKGKHTTNCIHCNYTCHKSCIYANDDQKRNCSAMGSNGHCTQCPDKCHWQKHANTPYIFEYISVKKKKTYEEKLKKYQVAEGERLTHEQVVQRMGDELTDLQEGIEYLMTTVKECNERLSEIALRPNPLSIVDHIDLMLKAEQMEKKQGYMQRITMLEEMKSRALITTKAADLQKQFKQHSKSFSGKGGAAAKSEKAESKPFSFKKFVNFFTG